MGPINGILMGVYAVVTLEPLGLFCSNFVYLFI